MSTIEIQCLCGAVKMELSGDPVGQFYCHCGDCQAVHGAAFVPLAAYPTGQTKVLQGELSTWHLKATPRGTCKECGTRMYAEPPNLGVRGITGHLLPEGKFEPAFHMQCKDAVMPVKDGLPHFAGFPAAFGGSDDTVDW